MAGFGDQVPMMGDWMPPSPSPRAFFSSLLGDDVGSRSNTEPTSETKTQALHPEPADYASPENFDQTDKLNSSLPESKMNSNGGLLERMAARAGFSAPKLNTESIRPVANAPNQEFRPPYMTIPPGLSPTTLLDSPVFLSNSLVQSSPTTGKFPFPMISGDSRSSKLYIGNSDNNNNESSFNNNDSQSFAFKPVIETGPYHFPETISKVPQSNLSRQSFHTQSEVLQQSVGGSVESSPPLDEPHDEDIDQRGGGDVNGVSAPADDGYNWRKYGQKQVKGSEYPRSYYKCTHPNCPVKKKVERSHEGHITEIIYKGAHNHLKPTANRRSANTVIEFQENAEQDGTTWENMQKGTCENIEVTSSGPLGPEHCNGDPVDGSSPFSNEEEEDDCGTHGSVSLGYDAEGDESDSKRRRIETYAADMSGASRAIREPRVVVQTTSEVDILDDGYRWRKYGQKVVKGNPNPRSYYKCTSAGCTVRKHVERASHDLKSVITTYEGKHNHDVPAARNSSHANPVASQISAPTQSHVHRPEPSQLQNTMQQFARPPLGSFGFPGPTLGFGFGMNQHSLANLGMTGLGPNQAKFHVPPVYPYIDQQRAMNNDFGSMLPKAELKTEPGVNVPDDSSAYQQFTNGLPLGPQM